MSRPTCPHCGNANPGLIEDNGCRGADLVFLCVREFETPEETSFEVEVEPNEKGRYYCGMQWSLEREEEEER